MILSDPLSQTFAALADPTRRAILARLRHGEASVNEIAEPFLSRMTLPGVTKHLKVLERAGLVTKTRDAQWRPCKLNPKPLEFAAEWMDEYRRHMEDSLDRLGEYLKTMQSIEHPTDVTTNRSRTRKRNTTTNTAPDKDNDRHR